MNRILVSLSVLFLLAAGCGDNAASQNAGRGDLETGQCQGADCIDAGDGGLDWGAPPEDAEAGEGDDTEASGAPADPCATHPNVRQCICARDPDAEECQEEARPLEISSRNDAMECTLDVPCEIKLRARGGSGSYEWSLRQSPEHLHTSLETRNDNKKATVTATPSLAGSYTFTAVLTDATSGESASKEITVRSTAAPVIAAYAGQENGRYSYATDRNQITLPLHKDLKLEITTHGSKLKSVRLRDVPCSKRIEINDNKAVLSKDSPECFPFINSRISLCGHPTNDTEDAPTCKRNDFGPINARTGAGESYTSTAYLRAVPGVNGTFVVEAEDEDGKVGTAEIDVGYAPDPCFGLELKIDGTKDTSVTLTIGAEVTAMKQLSLTVSGGKGPFRIEKRRTTDDGSQGVEKQLELDNNKGPGRTFTATATATIKKGVRLKDLYDENVQSLTPQTYEVTVTDDHEDCRRREATATVAIRHAMEEDIVMHEDEFTSSIKVGSNDTDSRSKLYASFKDRDMHRIAKWVSPINLDDVGGSDTDEPEVIKKKIEAMGDGGVPNKRQAEGLINMTKFSHVFFRMEDPGSGGALDTRIYWFRVRAGDWCGKAVIDDHRGYFENSCEDEKDGSDAADCQVTFPIRWMTCEESGNKYVPPPLQIKTPVFTFLFSQKTSTPSPVDNPIETANAGRPH